MAKTLVGMIRLVLQDGASAGAKKVANSLEGVKRAAASLGPSAMSADRLAASLNRLGSAPWGVRFQSQLERMKLSGRDFDAVRSSWEKLRSSLAQSADPKMNTRAIAAWRTATLGHFAAIQAGALKTETQLARLSRIGLVTAGAGTATYATGRGVRGALTASAEFERAQSRGYFAGLQEGERLALKAKARQLAPKYGLSNSDVLEGLTDSALGFGSTKKALETADSFAPAQAFLANMFGADQAKGQIRKLAKGLDVLGVEDPARIRTLVEQLTQAQLVEGKEFNPEEWAMALRYARSAKGFFSDEFLSRYMPALIAESSGSDVGTMLQAGFRNLAMGKAPKETLAAQVKYGIRDEKSGALINRAEYLQNPLTWWFNRGMPALQKAGVDLTDQDALAEAIGSIQGTRVAGDLISRAFLSRAQYERKAAQQYPNAAKLDQATQIREQDPFAAAEALKNSLKGIADSTEASAAAAQGLNALSSGVNQLNAALSSGDLSKINSLSGALTGLGAAAVAGGGLVMAGKGALNVLAMASAGPKLVLAADALTLAAARLGTAGGLPDVPGGGGSAKKGKGLLGKLMGLVRSPAGIGIAGAGALVGALEYYGSEERPEGSPTKRSAAAIRAAMLADRATTLKGTDEDLDRGEANRQRALSVDSSGLDGLSQKATEAQTQLSALSGVNVSPTVDLNPLVQLIRMGNEAKQVLDSLGSSARAAQSALGNGLRSAYSDYGVSP